VSRIFILSPANCNGARARQVLSPQADFPLARELRSSTGAPLGDVFSFVSGLYFRGKLTYARRFAVPDENGGSGIHIITPNAGLRAPETCVTRAAIAGFAEGEVDAANVRYRRPLEQSALRLADELAPDCDVVLLGSVATPKYVDVLEAIFGHRLRFPLDFVGRGDMSRGGLLLRRAQEGSELVYAPVSGTMRHGRRPPKLPRNVPTRHSA
jgi:hypothetical protein